MSDLNRPQSGKQRPSTETNLGQDIGPSQNNGMDKKSGSFQLFDHDIRATTKAFNTKIQQKKKEQERFLDEAEKKSRIRQSYIIQALVGMRKSLREVTRLDMGERFHFAVITDDWMGWPRVTLKVIDHELIDAEYPHFQILGGYRDEKAQIDIDLGDSENVLTYNLVSEADVKKLSGVFKKSVRSFLDMIGDVILQAERAPVEKPIENISAPVVSDEDLVEEDNSLSLGEDLYEEYGEENLFEALPHLEEVDTLPGWGGTQGPPKNRR